MLRQTYSVLGALSLLVSAEAWALPMARHQPAISSSSSLWGASPAIRNIPKDRRYPSLNDKSDSIYTSEQMKTALDSLLDDSQDPKLDGRHLLGYGQINNDSIEFHNHHSGELSKLQEITATVVLDYARYRSLSSTPSITALEEAAEGFSGAHGPIRSLRDVIRQSQPRMALAAEFKRSSPSKGVLAPPETSASEQGVTYAQAGADIVSVLTEPRWFTGSLQDLTDIRLATSNEDKIDDEGANRKKPHRRPVILRKDFCVSKYMIAEAAAAGADTILLIVAVLPQHLLKQLIDYARSFGMEPLVEVHADEEVEVALDAGAKVIGVNNRNLHNFQLDQATSERIADVVRRQGRSLEDTGKEDDDAVTLCALSGIANAADVDRYRQAGIRMCLVGESLMRAPDPAALIHAFGLDPRKQVEEHSAEANGSGPYKAGLKLVKVCGITNPEDARVACQAGATLIGVIFAEKSKRRVGADQAKAIAETVQRFGERTGPMDWSSLLVESDEDRSDSIQAHFAKWANRLSTTCSQRPLVVGVFQNQSPEFIARMVRECGLDLVQLHGNEGMGAAASSQCGGVPTIRVVDVNVETENEGQDIAEILIRTLTNDPKAILLDTAINGQEGGGTGIAFDWNLAGRIQQAGIPVIVAGGLVSETVADCVGSVQPFGVDVSSGVEHEPGKKDSDKVSAFVRGARDAGAVRRKRET